MAKNLAGDLVIASANRLLDGVVVYLDEQGEWTPSLQAAAIARDSRAADFLLERARTESWGVVDPFLVAVTEDEDGTIEPLSLREKIRAAGLTFDAIAAEAIRYA